jgi:hypothetical protein
MLSQRADPLFSKAQHASQENKLLLAEVRLYKLNFPQAILRSGKFRYTESEAY